MSKAKLLALTAVFLLWSTSGVAQPGRPGVDGIESNVTQLPRTAIPRHYAIEVAPDPAHLTFSGHVGIDMDVVQATASLTLNAKELTFGDVTIRGGDRVARRGTPTIDATRETVTFTFAEPLAPGRYRLDIAYRGVIHQQANGLFALDSKAPDGSTRRSLYTQFEAADARGFVPSWDEPDYKSLWDLSVVVPGDQMAIGNMPAERSEALPGGMKRVTFATTPLMSSYLLFLGAGEFGRIATHVGTTEVAVTMTKGNEAKARTALDAEAQVLPYYNDYFGTAYPLPKLENVAGPGQSQFFGAMENWGAIFTFERILLDDPAITSDRFGAHAVPSLRSALNSIRSRTSQEDANPAIWKHVHLLWLLERLDAGRDADLVYAAERPNSLIRVHAQRILAARTNLSAELSRVVVAHLSDTNALVARCAAEALGAHPELANLRPLLTLQERVPAEDTHLAYVVKKALRDHLRNTAVLQQVVGSSSPTWSEAELKSMLEVAVAVPSPGAATFLVRHLDHIASRGQGPLNDALLQCARHAPESELAGLVQFVRARFQGQPDFQLALFKSMDQGLQQRGVALPSSLRDWGSALAAEILTGNGGKPFGWANLPLETIPTENPWDFQERTRTDGKTMRVLSSLARGEQMTGVLRSPEFVAGNSLSFWICGHDGYPDKPAKQVNGVRLRHARTSAVLFEVAPPRNDVAREVTWNTGPLPAKVNPSAASVLRMVAVSSVSPVSLATRAKSNATVNGLIGGAPATRFFDGVPPATSSIIAVARSSPGSMNAGSTPRSKR